ncbi:Mediator of RNA polymerase II transcription subunit 28 [Cricetulus griseus]|uniref:Mediator of RNA polymerase II transcription subunit 28 n=1 Tax=Cricetulus griseus TaxID=10029 RepID=G3HW98_CRIGR|nr:Mediator of RNA polymerase II transcription subunit 28 [Cricetulus griseus]
MAVSLGGMFSGQPPGPPPPLPRLTSQALFQQAAPRAPKLSNKTLVDELESSFEACFTFLKPDQVIREEVSELRSELQQKDALVQKHLTKLRHWQQVLEDINVQPKKPAEIPQDSLAYLEQASANIPAPLKQA